jgi:AraC-like DNA-binding protein
MTYMSPITFTVVLPPEMLSKDVECIRISEHRGEKALEIKVCPNGLPGIVFQCDSHGQSALESISTRSVTYSHIPLLFLYRQRSEPAIMHCKEGSYSTLQVVLKPWALYTLFDLDASTLKLSSLQAKEFGAAELYLHLLAADSDTTRVSLLMDFLRNRFQQTKRRDTLVEASIRLIHNRIDSVTVQDLLRDLYISERQFQKRFSRVIGASPQQYIRVKRVNEALRLMGTGAYEQLSDIAYALNYYDQSHFIRDIKALSWVTPKSITQKISDLYQDQVGTSYL